MLTVILMLIVDVVIQRYPFCPYQFTIAIRCWTGWPIQMVHQTFFPFLHNVPSSQSSVSHLYSMSLSSYSSAIAVSVSESLEMSILTMRFWPTHNEGAGSREHWMEISLVPKFVWTPKTLIYTPWHELAKKRMFLSHQMSSLLDDSELLHLSSQEKLGYQYHFFQISAMKISSINFLKH